MLTIEEIEKKLENNEKIDWLYISKDEILSEEFMRKFADKVNWKYISEYQILSESFIRQFQDKVYWYYISQSQILSESFIRKFKDKVDWHCISQFQKLSEKFIRENQNRIMWNRICKYQVLSEEFIREFAYEVNWAFISMHQLLSENFIRDFQKRISWVRISKFQKLTQDFIYEFHEKLDLFAIVKYQKLSKKFIYKLGLSIPYENMLYWTQEEKINRIKEFDIEYNEQEECIYAYKSVHRNLSSVYKPSFQYKLNEKITNRNCDCNINENCSFGLSAWDRVQALEYFDGGKLLKVKIDLKDLGCITSEGKIRAFALTPIEIVE